MSALEGEDGTYKEELDEAALSSDGDDADEGDHEIGALEDIPDEISINMEELAQRLGRGLGDGTAGDSVLTGGGRDRGDAGRCGSAVPARLPLGNAPSPTSTATSSASDGRKRELQTTRTVGDTPSYNPNAVIKLPRSKTRRVQGFGSAPTVVKRELRAFQILQHLQPSLLHLLPPENHVGSGGGGGAAAAAASAHLPRHEEARSTDGSIASDGIPHCYGIHDVADGRDGSRGLVLERVVGARFDGLAAVFKEQQQEQTE
eukprot:gene26227-24471_t